MRKLCTLLVLLASPVYAKNMDGRLGMGVTSMSFTQSAGMSVKYFHTALQATSFLAGFNTESNSYQLGIKPTRLIVLEENMNVFLGIGAYLVNDQVAGVSAAGLQFDAVLGGEFFLPGLPNLGLQFEMGIGLRSQRTTSFRSIGGGFAQGAVHYYF